MRLSFPKLLILAMMTILLFGLFSVVFSQEDSTEEPAVQTSAVDDSQEKSVLTQAFMCEKVENNTPINQASVFSVSRGQVCCFTSFDPVPQPTLIYHRWYHRDELSTQIRLRLYPPLWSTYSQIQLRETDKGPWRVEITDQNGRIFDVIRFSITD